MNYTDSRDLKAMILRKSYSVQVFFSIIFVYNYCNIFIENLHGREHDWRDDCLLSELPLVAIDFRLLHIVHFDSNSEAISLIIVTDPSPIRHRTRAVRSLLVLGLAPSLRRGLPYLLHVEPG
jgi:hypothetical protein